jgi:hypothetical protein
MGLTRMVGTGVPGMQHETRLPFADPGRLAAKHTFVPPGANQEEQGPIVQDWDLKAAP